jgi:hypothetical protein
MIIIAPQCQRTQNTQNLAGPIPVNPLTGLGCRFANRHPRQQILQQAPPVLQERRAQGRFDPFGGKLRPLLEPLRKDFQEGFGFLVALGLDSLKFFLRSASDARV